MSHSLSGHLLRFALDVLPRQVVAPRARVRRSHAKLFDLATSLKRHVQNVDFREIDVARV